MIKRNRRSRGFTLVEILVVLLIASIVMAILVTVLGSSFEILRAGETKAQMNSEVRTALNYLTNEISTASYIPIADDRDLNGYRDELENPSQGYYTDAIWRVAWRDSSDIAIVASSSLLSEAWSDRIMLNHDNLTFRRPALVVTDTSLDLTYTQMQSAATSRKRGFISQGNQDQVPYRSFFRLALPVAPVNPAVGKASDMPYYLLPPDRVYIGSNPPGRIYGYPDVVSAGPHKETAALMQDLFTYYSDTDIRRSNRIAIASNITRVKYEYLHEVPVYVSRVFNNQIQVAYQQDEQAIVWRPEFWRQSDVNDGEVPLIDHWELRPVDVAYDGQGTITDGVTNATYAPTNWMLADQYPEGLDVNKLDGGTSGIDVGTGVGLGTISAGGNSISTGWNCSVFYNTSRSGGPADNAPVDRMAFVTKSLSDGREVDGGLASLRPDMSELGAGYIDYAEDPTGIGDFGDADGIPDGDGIPDDPVPGWWLPYVRAIRVTVVATPRQVIQERLTRSGQIAKSGTVVYYRLDSPIPYADAARTQPLTNQKQDYLGNGKDLVLSKTIPVTFSYSKLELIAGADPVTSEGGTPTLTPTGWWVRSLNSRRVEINYYNAIAVMGSDPSSSLRGLLAQTPWEKLYESEST